MSGGRTSAFRLGRGPMAAAILLQASCSSSSAPTATAGTPLPSGSGWSVEAITRVSSREGTPVVAGGLVWVPNMAEGSISAVNASDGRVERTVRIGDPGFLLRQGCGTSSVHATPHGSFDIRRCDVPNALAYDGKSLWVTLNDARVLLRLDPVSGRTLATIPLGIEAFGLGAGAAGVWVSDFEHDSVVHFDRSTGAVLATISGMPPGPSGIAVGQDAVWVACARANSIARIDPITNKVVAELPLGKSPLPVAIAFGSVWVRSEEGDRLTRIDPATNRVVATTVVGTAEGLDGLDQFGIDATGLWLSGLRIAHVSAASNLQDRVLGYDGPALDYGRGRLWAIGILGTLSRIRVN